MSAQTTLTLLGIAQVIERHAYAHVLEHELQRELARLLTEAGYVCKREWPGSNGNRFDLFIDGGIVLECKVKGPFPLALDQCARYLQDPVVTGLVLCGPTTWMGRRAMVRLSALYGKPATFAAIHRMAF